MNRLQVVRHETQFPECMKEAPEKTDWKLVALNSIMWNLRGPKGEERYLLMKLYRSSSNIVVRRQYKNIIIILYRKLSCRRRKSVSRCISAYCRMNEENIDFRRNRAKTVAFCKAFVLTLRQCLEWSYFDAWSTVSNNIRKPNILIIILQ